MAGNRIGVGDENILVSVRKFDGTEHRNWRAQIARIDHSLIVLDAVFDQEIEHDLLGKIECGTLSTEYYWFEHWYNVFRFARPDGTLRSFYCNVNVPPQFDGKVLSYIDLDIDLLVEPDLSYRILDVEDFEINAERYAYPLEVKAGAKRAVKELIELIEARAFPFSE